MPIRVTIARDGFLDPDHTPRLNHDLLFVPCEDVSALARSLARADALVTRRANVNDELLGGAAKLRLVQQVGTGTDRIDFTATSRRGIAVANTPGAPAPAVVEHTFLLILALLRGLPAQLEAVRAGAWSAQDVWEGRELGGSTLGILGYGAIGSGVAERALAFGATVIVTTRTVPQMPPPGVRFVDLDTLLRESDVLVLAPALNAQTRALIDRKALAAMKPTALIINVSRGAVIEESALIEALAAGRLAGAGLDAFMYEPLPLDSPFRRMSRVVATPHSAGSSQQSRRRIWDQIADNLDNLAEGRPLRNVVDSKDL
jgi:phosphoglycerate dehydrogenase-like enzyme